MGSIKYGVQDTKSEKSIKYGIREGGASDFDRRPNRGDKDAAYKFDKQNGAKVSGHANTQSQGRGKHSSNAGSSSFTPKGKVSTFGSGRPSGAMKSGLSGQRKGHGA